MPLNIRDSEENLPEEKPEISDIVPAPPEKKVHASRFAAIFFVIIVLAAVVFLLYTYEILPIHKSRPVSDQIAQMKSAQTTSPVEQENRDTVVPQHPVVAQSDTVRQSQEKERGISTLPGSEKTQVPKEAAPKVEEKKAVAAAPAPKMVIVEKKPAEKPASTAKSLAEKKPSPKKTPVEKPVPVPKNLALKSEPSKRAPAVSTKPPAEKSKAEVKPHTVKPAPAGKTTPPQKAIASNPPLIKKGEKKHASAGSVKPAVPSPTKGRLALYISSYHERKFAEEDVARWRDAGFDAFVSDAGEWHRVAIGRFDSVIEAKKEVDSLKQAFEYGYWIGPS